MSRRLWHDETGGVGSAELVLIMTIMTIGMVVGMKTFRDAAVTEFADLAQALSELDQSYSFGAQTLSYDGTTLTTTASWFTDQPDFCDTQLDQDEGERGSKGITVAAPARSEYGGP